MTIFTDNTTTGDTARRDSEPGRAPAVAARGAMRARLRHSRRARLVALPVVVGAAALTLAACGSSSPSGSGANGSGGTTTSTTNTGGTGTGTTASSATATVHSASTSSGTVLENSSDMPLYTFGPDGTGTTSKCSGACAMAWPAVTVPAGTTPTAGSGVSGTLGTAKQANGTEQVTYNGKLLYTFVSDSPGKVTGNGVANFSVVKASATASSTNAGSGGGGGTSPTTTSANGGGGYQY